MKVLKKLIVLIDTTKPYYLLVACSVINLAAALSSFIFFGNIGWAKMNESMLFAFWVLATVSSASFLALYIAVNILRNVIKYISGCVGKLWKRIVLWAKRGESRN